MKTTNMRLGLVLLFGILLVGMLAAAAPAITLLYPANDIMLTDTPVFSFNVTADTSTVNCSVYAAGTNWSYAKIDEAHDLVAGNILMNSPGWSLGMENDRYRYYINCTDTNMVYGVSGEDTFEILRALDTTFLQVGIILGLVIVSIILAYLSTTISKRHGVLQILFLLMSLIVMYISLDTISRFALNATSGISADTYQDTFGDVNEIVARAAGAMGWIVILILVYFIIQLLLLSGTIMNPYGRKDADEDEVTD